MTNQFYENLRERAKKHPTSQFVRLPVVPSLGMIVAAGDTSDVFNEGDNLWEWFEPYADEHDADSLKVHPDLVERFGLQKAFALACIADLWGLAIEGVEFWRRDRSRNPATPDDLIHYIPDRCPEGGWPKDKAQCTDEHKAHARMSSEPFSTYWTSWQGIDPEIETVAPRRLPSQAARWIAHSYLSVDSWMETQDAVALGKAPYVPHWTGEGSFIEEERYALLLAAIWRGAVGYLVGDDTSDGTPFPFHDDTQAVIVSNIVFRQPSLRRSHEKFIDGAPFDRFCVTTERSMISIATDGGLTSFWYQDLSGGRITRIEGVKLHCGRDRSGLTELLTKVCAAPVVKFEFFKSDTAAEGVAEAQG